MFRRLPHTLPPDPVFEPDFKSLGFFINDDDQIRMLKNPTHKYQFKINRNERVNQAYNEAMNAATGKVVQERLAQLGFETIRLPLGAREEENHVPILVSKDIGSKDRVIVFLGERHQAPGMLSWRVIGEEGIKVGSLLEFAHAVKFGPTPTPMDVAPGVIIANPCQLLWYRGGSRAVSAMEWLGIPRASAVHEPFRIDPVKNRIPENGTYEEHVRYIFDHVLPKLVKKEAKLDIIGLEFPGTAVVGYLASHWTTWSSRITGISLVGPQYKLQDLLQAGASDDFVDFISRRCRAYFVSASKMETAISGREIYGCNCYASGETLYSDNAIVRCWGSILDWFNTLYVDPSFEEVPFVIVDDGDDAEEVKLGW